MLASDPKCYQTFLVYSCTTYFPHCSPFLNNTPQWQCKSDCLAAQDACRSIFTVGGHPEDLPKCDQVPNGAPDHTPYPEKNCYSLGNNTDKGPIECPAPLIRNPFNGTRVPLTCPAYGGQCCFPCPVYHNLYPTTPGAKWEEDLVAKLNAVSVVLLLVVLGLWMGRPGILASSRTATVLFSLLNALGLALLSSGILLFKRDEMMCANPVEDSTGGFWCTLEGLGYAFFGQAFSFSEALFNVNLFLTLHYLRDPIPVSLAYKLFAAIWVVAAGLNTLPYAISGSSHQFGIHCSPKNLHLYRNLSLMPLIAGLVVSIVLGFVNVGYVAKMGWDLHIRGEGGGGVALNESGVDEPETEPETEGEAEDSELVASTRASGDKESGNPRLDTFRQSWRTSILSFLVANAFLVFTVSPPPSPALLN